MSISKTKLVTTIIFTFFALGVVFATGYYNNSGFKATSFSSKILSTAYAQNCDGFCDYRCGTPCESSPNLCGRTNTGTYDCSGYCPGVYQPNDPETGYGDTCTSASANNCGTYGIGYMTCSGGSDNLYCNAVKPADGTIACTSDSNCSDPDACTTDRCNNAGSCSSYCSNISNPINGDWSGWGTCSNTCGSGTQTRSCNNPSQACGGSNCVGSNTQSCEDYSTCSYNWQTTAFDSCSVSCGPGTQNRSVACVRSDGTQVDDSFCPGAKPAISQPCNNGACASCTPDGSCSAAAPSCEQTTYGLDNCDNQCQKVGSSCSTCVSDANSCDAATPPCGQTTTGLDNCNRSCQKTGPSCSVTVTPSNGVTPTPDYSQGSTSVSCTSDDQCAFLNATACNKNARCNAGFCQAEPSCFACRYDSSKQLSERYSCSDTLTFWGATTLDTCWSSCNPNHLSPPSSCDTACYPQGPAAYGSGVQDGCGFLATDGGTSCVEVDGGTWHYTLTTWTKLTCNGQQHTLNNGVCSNNTSSCTFTMNQPGSSSTGGADGPCPGGAGPSSGAVCGNHNVESPETCDDGNLVNGDGCDKDCKLEKVITVSAQPTFLSINPGNSALYVLTSSSLGAPIANAKFTFTGGCPSGATCSFNASGNSTDTKAFSSNSASTNLTITNTTTVVAPQTRSLTFKVEDSSCSGQVGCPTATGIVTLDIASSASRTIKGSKVIMPGNQAIAPAAAQAVSLDGGSPTTANPYIFSNVSSGNHTVSVPNISGYNTGYTLCYNGTTCHSTTTPTAGNSVVVSVPAGGYADLWWHYTPSGGVTADLKGTVWTNSTRNTAWGGYSNIDGPVIVYETAPYGLTWTSNATTCLLDGVSVTPNSSNNTYTAGTNTWTRVHTLACTSAAGSASDTFTISIPPPPTNPGGSCGGAGTSLSLSWSAPAGYNSFYVRVVDLANNSVFFYTNDNYSGTTITVPNTISGHTYSWWVHTRNAVQGAYSTAVGTNVVCGTIVAPHISLAGGPFNFSGYSGGPTPASQNSLTLTNTVSGTTLKWKASTDQSWCHVSPTTGTLSNTSPVNLTLSVDAPSRVTTAQCNVKVEDNSSSPAADNSPQTVAVTYTVASCADYLVPASNNSTATFTNITSNGYTINWNPNSGPVDNWYGYKARLRFAASSADAISCNPGVNSCIVKFDTNSAISSYTVTGASPNTTYYNRIPAVCWDFNDLYNPAGNPAAAENQNNGYNQLRFKDNTPYPTVTTLASTPVNPINPGSCNSQTSCASGGGTPACANVRFQFTDNSTNEDGFKIYKNSVNSTSSAALIKTITSTTVASTGQKYTYDYDLAGDTAVYYYWVTAFSSTLGQSAYSSMNSIAAFICGPTIINSDKEIVKINGATINPAPTACNQDSTPLPSYIVPKLDDVLTFSVNICNTNGSTVLTGITVSDTLVNLIMPTSGWNMCFTRTYGDCSVGTPITTVGSGSGKYTVSGNTLNINLTGSSFNIPAGQSAYIMLDAQLPNNTSSRLFQNTASINYTGSAGALDVFTPFQQFLNGANAPIIRERP